MSAPAPTGTIPQQSKAVETPVLAKKRGFPAAIASIMLLAAIIVAVASWHKWWPFEPIPITKNLEESTDSKIQFRAFRRVFFPHPGCVLDGVVFTHDEPSEKPLITIEKLTIIGSYFGLLHRYVSEIKADGMHVFIPPLGTGRPFNTKHSGITVGTIVADGAALEIGMPNSNAHPLRFEFRQARFRNAGWQKVLAYQVIFMNPLPPGQITASGSFGPWSHNAADTPTSGEFKFENADLGLFNGIAGILSSTGKFHGKLGHIDVSGSTEIPDFQVTMSHHSVSLRTEFAAHVDATNGDTYLERVHAHFRNTDVFAYGSVAKQTEASGKTASVHFISNDGQIEDILGLFVQKSLPPMSGAVKLSADATIPPGKTQFLKKLEMKGGFGIAAGKFTTPSTQQGADRLSAGARGEKLTENPETVLSDLAGEVAVHNGIAAFDHLSFRVPGAHALLDGTYNLLNHKIDLRGQMRVDTDIAKTTTGAKSLLLKFMNPFFRRNRKGQVLPIKISGNYEHPSFGLDLQDKKAKIVLP